jgi:serine protease Do
VIRKKGDKDKKIVVEINGDKVTINGKPIAEYKDDDVTINKRNVTVWNRGRAFTVTPDGFDGLGSMNWNGDDEPYAFLGVTTDDDENGAKVTDVTKESAAEKAGLKEGDIITKIGDKKVDGPESLTEAIRSHKPKEEVTVSYKREGKEGSTKVKLGEKKGGMAYAFSGPGMSKSFSSPYVFRGPDAKSLPKVRSWGENGNNDFNFNFDNNFDVMSDGLFGRSKLGLKIQDTEEGNGVKVLDVDKDSPADKAGLKKDDVVTEVGGTKVKNTDEARHELQQNREKGSYNVKAKRNGSEMSFEVKIPKKLKTTNL